MEHFLAKAAFIVGGILVGYLLIRLISALSKGRVNADLFSAINVFLYLGLAFNLYFGFTKEKMGYITAGVIVLVLLFRAKKTSRWI
jgi:hypothetical protein